MTTRRGPRRVAVCGTIVLLAASCGGSSRDASNEASRPPDFVAAPADMTRSLKSAVEDMDVTGASIAVIDDDGYRWHAAAGDAETTTPFAIASITKMFTSALALRLAERGVVDLDAPSGIPGVDPASLRDLLGHTAGLRYDAFHDALHPWTVSELTDHASSERACAPGDCFHYSDLGFVAAGLVLEREADASLRSLYEREIFGPLGLEHTTLVDSDHVPDGLADTDEPQPGARPPARAVPINTWSAGAIATTASDLARFADALVGGELLSHESLATMLDGSRSLDLQCDEGCERPYGLGATRFRLGGHPGWGHSGSSGAHVIHFDEGVTVAVLTTRPTSGRAILERLTAEAIPALAPLSDIYEVDADGGEPHRLFHRDGVDLGPAWSPDGEHVVYASRREDERAQLFVLDVATDSEHRLMKSSANDLQPAWSPDGSLIAFVRDDTRTSELYVVGADGSGERQVTTHGTHALWSPTFSPDGTLLAYELGEPDMHGSDIAIVGVSGSDPHVIHDDGDEWRPTWSPDANRIAYWRENVGIMTMNPDGTDQRRLDGTTANDLAPAWGPDGRIAFLSDKDVWTTNAEGTDRQQVTHTEAEERWPSWSPDGRRLIFTSDAS